MIKIRRGLDLPITGKPVQSIEDGPQVTQVALIGFDYNGMKPTMSVQEGDSVKLGQELFSDKKTPGVIYTAPAAGKVVAINRGEQRVFQSIVIEINGDDAVEFPRFEAAELTSLAREKVQHNLVNSGLWTALRTRPYSKVPAVASVPSSIFVQAMDTNPLAADPAVIIATDKDAFANGLKVLSRLTDGKVFVCQAPAADIPKVEVANVAVEQFDGVHPAGNPGTHIHFLDPVSARKTVWSIGYQDVMAIGQLFVTGRLPTTRVVALAGPQVESPRLVRTRIGADLTQLTQGQTKAGDNRLISGSVFGGRRAQGKVNFLGRFHTQVSVLTEGRDRELFHYLRAGTNKFSVLGLYVSSLISKKTFSFTTSTNGSERAMVPVGSYEKIMPLDILPTQLMRALIVGDTETAQQLGCLELDEDDVALCTFVCPGKYEYGPLLRNNLTRIEQEG
jgi:Na+-transporting NADH:ubiquinone oxidoreductase subunit A